MTRSQLRSRYKRVFPDVWIDKEAEITFYVRSLAAGHWMKGDGVLCGFSAAALHGTQWIDDKLPAEIACLRWRGHPDLIVRREKLLPDETTEIADFTVTTPARTAYDLARRLPFDDAVVAVDALAAATKIEEENILTVLGAHPDHGRSQHVKTVAAAMDSGAESPQETRTRLTLVDYGLPRPETQIIIRDDAHTFVARSDMGYRQWRVLVEYEGEQHGEDEQFEIDVERYYRIRQLGWEVIQVTAGTLRQPWLVADRVERALRARGWSA